jgi:hypothetical protein
MELVGWGSLTSPWLDDCACSLSWSSSHVLTLIDHPLVASFEGSGACNLIIEVWYICLSWIWMMVLALQKI